MSTFEILQEKTAQPHEISMGLEIPADAKRFLDPAYPDLEVYQLIDGGLEVTTSQVKPQVIEFPEPFPFPIDEVVFILDGEAHTYYEGKDQPTVAKKGQLHWLPKGAVVTKQEFFAGETGYYRDMIITPPSDDIAPQTE